FSSFIISYFYHYFKKIPSTNSDTSSSTKLTGLLLKIVSFFQPLFEVQAILPTNFLMSATGRLRELGGMQLPILL
ncbi:MAG: hypothetical protein IJ486_08525, partial [Firmicutes bacterium]|nr:hypothetical protein [Bacillota bacterium]